MIEARAILQGQDRNVDFETNISDWPRRGRMISVDEPAARGTFSKLERNVAATFEVNARSRNTTVSTSKPKSIEIVISTWISPYSGIVSKNPDIALHNFIEDISKVYSSVGGWINVLGFASYYLEELLQIARFETFKRQREMISLLSN
ncbi:hypothetical protein HZH66_007897 [Vespula vulgaris]|uniref:Uncharacterized protein n=1 Tax=Vespula vulgaris TaxID=7454 RepID=A0A834JTY3_VESVU|nr:hypothetical protein HZH66_007897 [Vespula vulgaris]